MRPRILFRADGNEQVGAGHVMRCLSLACAAKKLGCECLFVMADDSFKNVIDSYGIHNVVLDTDYKEILSELAKLTIIITEYQANVVIVDSYYVKPDYFNILKNFSKVVYIDDLVEKAYSVDALINYNSFADKNTYMRLYDKDGLEFPFNLLGVKYAPLREEFQDIIIENQKKSVHDVLFSAGGADSERIAIKFVKELIKNESELYKYNFHIVLGSFEPDKDEIKNLANSRSWIYIHENVTKMSELMLKCQMAISAAGSTLYELCACGVPTITYILADNQISGAEVFSNDGTMINAGDFRNKTNFFKNLIFIIKNIINDDDLRFEMSQMAKKKVDGNGAKRTIEELNLFFSNNTED